MNKQRGVVLVVALVMLLVVTLLGVAVMRGATLDVKMANNNQERQQAFNAAEAALARAEAFISNTSLTRNNLYTTCGTGTNCFNNTCTNGLCFFGVFDGTTNFKQAQCQVVPSSGIPHADPWSDASLSVWSNTSRYVAVTVPRAGTTALTAKYIIEFRCFIDGDTNLVNDGLNGAGDILFRITARGQSASTHTEVMLQSTYRRASP